MKKQINTNETLMSEEEMSALTVQIPKSLHREIKTYSSSKGLKLRELVINVFEEVLKDGRK